MRASLSLGVAFGLVVCALLACSSNGDKKDDNNFREDVIECEDALDKLIDCCPGFDATPVLCTYYYSQQSGCTTSTTESVQPAFSLGESKCIRDKSCGQMQEDGVCERAQKARAYTYRSVTTDNTPDVTQNTHELVCK